jgi:hypothetical protein
MLWELESIAEEVMGFWELNWNKRDEEEEEEEGKKKLNKLNFEVQNYRRLMLKFKFRRTFVL